MKYKKSNALYHVIAWQIMFLTKIFCDATLMQDSIDKHGKNYTIKKFYHID